MKNLLSGAAFIVLAICLAPRASAEVVCGSYFNTTAYDDSRTSFCWMCGAICYNCADTSNGVGCAADWGPCDPYENRHPPTYNLAATPASQVAPEARVADGRSRRERAAGLNADKIL